MVEEESIGLRVFERYLFIWVLLAMCLGALLGYFFPILRAALDAASIFHVSFPIAVLLWLMMAPITLKVDFASLRNVGQNPKPLALTTIMNWVVNPFLMFGLAMLFFQVVFAAFLDNNQSKYYVVGAAILGGSPCTAMVFVWCALVHGDAAYMLVQVALNDVLILILYAPTLFLLIRTSGLEVPYMTIALSVLLFVVIPFSVGALVRVVVYRRQRRSLPDNEAQAETNLNLTRISQKLYPLSCAALLLTIIVIFIAQGHALIRQPVDILMIAVPLCLKNYIAFGIVFALAYKWSIEFEMAACCGFIAASNFFELGVGVAISAYGSDSPVTLVNVVGVLVEVPVMLSLVKTALYLRY